jgi:hypothetical protein
MARGQALGDIKAPAPEDERHMVKLQAAVFMGKSVILASAGIIAIWMVMGFILIIYTDRFEDSLKIMPAIIPFWGTISGAVLGYLFGKNDP